MKIDEGIITLIYKTIRSGLKISTKGPFVEIKFMFSNENEITFQIKKNLFKDLRDLLNEVEI